MTKEEHDARDEKNATTSHQPLQKNALEWTVFALSLVLVLGVVGLLAFHAMQQENAPPTFHFRFEGATRQDSLYLLPVVVRNTGDQTAAEVTVEVTSGPEQAEIVLPYVPRHSERRGAALFRTPPEAPTARVRSYSLP